MALGEQGACSMLDYLKAWFQIWFILFQALNLCKQQKQVMATNVDIWITQQITLGALVVINCGLGTYVRLIMVILCRKL